MNIKNFFDKNNQENSENIKYAGSFRRSMASSLDMAIVLFLRVFTGQILGLLFLNNALMNFLSEFREKFGTEFVKNDPSHIDFVVHHRFFLLAIMFYAIIILVGALYYALLNSSAWQATIGKRIMKTMMVREDRPQVTFGIAISHYFLSILPFIFILYLISYQVTNHLNFFQTVTASEGNLFFGIIFILWVQIHLFNKRKATAYDLICKTFLINGRTSANFPWSK